MVPPTPNASAHEPDIALWGGVGSGKTAFLASLSVALNRAEGANEGWRIIGADDVSNSELTRLRTNLLDHRIFPRPTDVLTSYNWLVIGPPAPGRRLWWAPWRRRPDRAPKITLSFLDGPGGLFGKSEYSVSKEELIKSLVKSRGLLYLFDPDRKGQISDAFKNLDVALREVESQMLSGDKYPDGKLPHYIAVCITKYDEPNILRLAEEYTDHGLELPRVPEDQAREFFREVLARDLDQNAGIIMRLLEASFHENRIKYFVTSSIGMYVDADRGYDPDDPSNIIDIPGQDQKIRGAVHPINIMEPVIWLGRMLYPKTMGRER